MPPLPLISRPYRLLSDERLARLAGDGSDAAFAALHGRYDAVLHGYTRSIARDSDDSSDALQNAWIAALIALRAGRRSAPVRPWLFRIAHNAAIDVLRRKSAAIRTLDRGFPIAVPGVDEQYDRTETVAEVVGDMRALPTNQRAALVMRELADLDYPEIAIALSTSEGNARQLVFAARDGLRESRAGRALPCESVRGVLARADGRELRRRRLRAHLDSCYGCRVYADSVARPARKVAGWAPTPALLQSILAAAGGSGAAMSQGGPFAGLARGAVAAALVVAGIGTGEYVVHQGGGSGDVGSAAPDTERGARAAGALVRPAQPRTGASAARTVPARTVEAASARAPRTVPAIATADGSTAGRRASMGGVQERGQSPFLHTTDAVLRSDQNGRRTRRSAPGGDPDPGDRTSEPHLGDRRSGEDAAGPRDRGRPPLDEGPRDGGSAYDSARGARAGGDCEAQAADSSAPASSRRDLMPSLR